MDPVVHFEMPYENRRRMADFYAEAFGWTANMLGSEMGEYVVVMTGEFDKKSQRPKLTGQINGGFFKRTKENRHPSVVIAVKDIRKSMDKVKVAGGTVLGARKPGEPDMIPGVGLYISFLDTEGNRVSLLQPSR